MDDIAEYDGTRSCSNTSAYIGRLDERCPLLELRGRRILWTECDEMTSLRKIAAPITFVTVICGAAILWPVYNEKATERKLAVAARIRAEQGDANAQYTLGFMYYQGQGVPRDDT